MPGMRAPSSPVDTSTFRSARCLSAVGAVRPSPGATIGSREKKGLVMKRFLVLYKAPASAFEQMKNTTPEQQKAGMEAWMTWSKKAGGAIVDMGAPLGKSLRVAKSGDASPTTNDLGGYSILQGESKEAVAASLKGHPHFMMPDGSIEVVELMPIPGV
jgi:hypothetical protein